MFSCRIDDAVRQQLESGGVDGSSATDLNACPACSKGVKALHCDACFKLRQRNDTGQPHGAPLSQSVIGVPTYDEETGEIVDKEMERFRSWRHDILRIPKGKQMMADPSGLCNSFASEASTKAASRKHKTTALHASVCRHNVLCTKTASRVDTVSDVVPSVPLIAIHALYFLGLCSTAWRGARVFPSRGKVRSRYL